MACNGKRKRTVCPSAERKRATKRSRGAIPQIKTHGEVKTTTVQKNHLLHAGGGETQGQRGSIETREKKKKKFRSEKEKMGKMDPSKKKTFKQTASKRRTQ